MSTPEGGNDSSCLLFIQGYLTDPAAHWWTEAKRLQPGWTYAAFKVSLAARRAPPTPRWADPQRRCPALQAAGRAREHHGGPTPARRARLQQLVCEVHGDDRRGAAHAAQVVRLDGLLELEVVDDGGRQRGHRVERAAVGDERVHLARLHACLVQHLRARARAASVTTSWR